MSLPGFTPGEKAQNTVVAVMYLVAIAAVVGGAILVVGMPGSGDTADPVANQSAGAVEGTQVPSETQTEARSSESGTSSSSGAGGSETVTSAAFPRISEDQTYLTVLRNTMENSSRVELLSGDIRQNEMYVRYTQDSMSQSDIRSGAGSISGIYFGLVGTGADLQAIHGRLVDDSGRVAYTYTVDREIVVKYNNGEITKQQLRQTIVNSIQSTKQTTPVST